jgi:hypothetical protein
MTTWLSLLVSGSALPASCCTCSMAVGTGSMSDAVPSGILLLQLQVLWQ